MFQVLLAGSVSVVGSITASAVLLLILTNLLTRAENWLLRPPHGLKSLVSLIGVSIWLMVTMGVAILPWSLVFLWLEAVPDFESAVYFAAVTFTTVGYGDVVLVAGTRLLSGLCAANGLLMFGLFTAFLIEFVRRLRQAQRVSDPDGNPDYFETQGESASNRDTRL